MARPFSSPGDAGLSRDELRQKRNIEHDFDAIEHFFFAQSASRKRLKPHPMAAIPTPAAVRSLSIVYALRTLELTEGVVLLIEAGNSVAALPSIRSVYEVVFAILYVDSHFSEFVNKKEPNGFTQTARRLLSAKSSGGDAGYPVPVGRMKERAVQHLRTLDKSALTTDPADLDPSAIAENLALRYDELSDGTHPTQWSMTAYTSGRQDGLGLDWTRKPVPGISRLYTLVHLSHPLALIRRLIVRLPRLAEEAEGLKAV